jgi:hypothetical protein
MSHDDCLIPGCRRPGLWKLGVRARLGAGKVSGLHPNKKPTDAAFAPDLPAYLCDVHVQGGLFTLLVEPRRYPATKVRAIGAPDNLPHRTVRVK